MYKPDDQRLVDNDTLSDLNINLNKMDKASNNIAVTESAVNLTENEDERWLQLSNLRFGSEIYQWCWYWNSNGIKRRVWFLQSSFYDAVAWSSQYIRSVISIEWNFLKSVLFLSVGLVTITENNFVKFFTAEGLNMSS